MKFSHLPALLILAYCTLAFADNPKSDKDAGKAQHDSKKIQVAKECVDHQPLPDQGASVSVDKQPVVIKRVEPEYPRIARQAGISGTVILSVLVDRCGTVRQAMIEKSSGTEALDDAALVAIRKWGFQPAEYQHKPVAVWTTVAIEFRLP